MKEKNKQRYKEMKFKKALKQDENIKGSEEGANEQSKDDFDDKVLHKSMKSLQKRSSSPRVATSSRVASAPPSQVKARLSLSWSERE